MGKAFKVKDKQQHGKWEKIGERGVIHIVRNDTERTERQDEDREDFIECSNCKNVTAIASGYTYKYCPWCGTEMDLADVPFWQK